MTGPSTPGQEGPSYAPPPLPEGWIAQWDGISRKYYFVQLSTGASQWETPIHPAPTGPTPQATPQEGIEHPYGVPQQEPQQRELDIVTNQDGSQSIRHPDGRLEPYSGERGIGSFVVNQYMHKQNGGHGQNQSGLTGMASQFLGGGKTHQGTTQSSGAGGIVGALAGSLLGGNKQNHQQQPTNYSGAPNPQQHQGGLMGSLGGMFGHQGASQGNNYGYSQGGNTPQGGYSGAPPPTAYQPNNAGQNNYNQPSLNQPFSQNSQPQPYSQPYNGQQPPYGGPQQYGTTPQQSPYGGAQAPYGAGPPQQYGGQGYPQGNGQAGYGAPPGMENQQFGGQGAPYQGGQPPIPHGSHPHQGHHNHHGQHGSGGPPPGYGQQQGGRW